MRESIQKAESSKWHEEALGRAQLHLALLLKEQRKEPTEAESLAKIAREQLTTYLQLDHPDYLKGSHDELAMFDNMQPVFEGRFTGRKLLGYIQDHARTTQGTHGLTAGVNGQVPGP